MNGVLPIRHQLKIPQMNQISNSYFQNAEQSQEKQIEAIREFVKQKVDVIAIAPVVETGWEPILREC